MAKINAPNMVDYKRNNRIAIRNFHESCDLHDTVKTLLVRMLRRNYPNHKTFVIYTEHNEESPNSDYPDIWMRDNKGYITVWEIQRKITEAWKKDILEKHENVTLIIVPIDDEMNNWSLSKLKSYLSDYAI